MTYLQIPDFINMKSKIKREKKMQQEMQLQQQ